MPRSAAGGQEFWCAAGDYARQKLGVSWQDIVYISRGRGPSEATNKRTAVQFSLNAATVGEKPGSRYLSINSLTRGDGMKVLQAMQFCNQVPIGF